MRRGRLPAELLLLYRTCIEESGPTAVRQEEGVIELTWQAISGMSSTPALVSTMDDQAVMADTWRSSSQSHAYSHE